jgi:hypothetical protein
MIERSKATPLPTQGVGVFRPDNHSELLEKEHIIATLQRQNADMSESLREKDNEILRLRQELSSRRMSGEMRSEDLKSPTGSCSSTSSDIALKYVKQQRKIIDLERMISHLETQLHQHNPNLARGNAEYDEGPNSDRRSSVTTSPLFNPLSPTGLNQYHLRMKELEAMLDKEKRSRAEEQMKYSQQIAALEAELTICQAELNVSDLFNNFSSS